MYLFDIVNETWLVYFLTHSHIHIHLHVHGNSLGTMFAFKKFERFATWFLFLHDFGFTQSSKLNFNYATNLAQVKGHILITCLSLT